MKAGSHGVRRGIEPVPGAADVGPAGGEGAGARRVVPCAAVEDPPGRHRAGRIKPVQGAVALVKAGSHGTAHVGLEPVPRATLKQPSGIRFAVRGCVIPSALF